jgi:hypothetical protein
MFQGFSQSVGVANIQPWLSLIQHPPRYITKLSFGAGFAETMNILLKKRKT